MQKEYDDNANYYVEKYHLLFLNIPKVASSTLWSVAAQLKDNLNVKSLKDIRKYKLPRIRSSRINEYPNTRKIAFVRNPFDRLVSTYKNKIETQDERFYTKNKIDRQLSFEEFVDFACSRSDVISDKHIRSQFTFLFDNRAELVVDYLGRLETFQQDIEQVIQQYELPEVKIPHWNKTENTAYKTYFTNKLRSKVEERYRMDLYLLGYNYENGLVEKFQDRWKNPLSDQQKIDILQYKSNRLLKVLHYKEKYDDLPKGIRGVIMRRYHRYFTNYFDAD